MLYSSSINDLRDDVICNIAIYAYYTTLYSSCDQISYLWGQLELVYEFESDLQGTMDWGRKWLVDFSGGEFQLILLENNNNNNLTNNNNNNNNNNNSNNNNNFPETRKY